MEKGLPYTVLDCFGIETQIIIKQLVIFLGYQASPPDGGILDEPFEDIETKNICK